MEQKKEKKKIWLLSSDELQANAKMCIVQVRFDNELDPIYLASEENLPEHDYIDYVNALGLYADKDYRVLHWKDK